MNTLKLGTIKEEAAACRAAWAAMPDAKYGVHIHHGGLAEPLYEPIENRIYYILRLKPENEQALRLHLMRPITTEQWKPYNEVIATAWKAYKVATAEVIASAWKAYKEATAGAIAAEVKAHDEAIVEAAKAYDEAIAEVEKARYEVFNQAHQLVCTTPGCPYKNGSIF